MGVRPRSWLARSFRLGAAWPHLSHLRAIGLSPANLVLGVHIVSANASEMIAEAAVLMEFGGSAEDLARTCHAHPTLTEAVKEAALAVDKRAIHM